MGHTKASQLFSQFCAKMTSCGIGIFLRNHALHTILFILHSMCRVSKKVFAHCLQLEFDTADAASSSGAHAHLISHAHDTFQKLFIVKLREREGQRVDLGRSLKGHL